MPARVVGDNTVTLFRNIANDYWFVSQGYLHCKTELKDEDGDSCNCIYFDDLGELCSDHLDGNEEVNRVDVEIRWTRRKEA